MSHIDPFRGIYGISDVERVKLPEIVKSSIAGPGKRFDRKLPKPIKSRCVFFSSPVSPPPSMNQATKPRMVPNSNPLSVLESIKAAHGIVNQLEKNEETGTVQLPVLDKELPVADASESSGTIPFRVTPITESSDDSGANPIEHHAESANQIQQLAERLKQNEQDYIRRSEVLDQKIENWNQTVSVQDAQYQKKLAQLQQQAAQVRCQQLHVMQLQSDIVKNYEVVRAALEQLLEQESVNEHSLAAMEILKSELGGRFDFIARRWNHLAGLMQRLRDQEATHVCYQCSSAKWAG